MRKLNLQILWATLVRFILLKDLYLKYPKLYAPALYFKTAIYQLFSFFCALFFVSQILSTTQKMAQF
jgi:hypothetical protein